MNAKEKLSRGITLVALVITIIILLILAGISISALTNQGLFKNAQKAKKTTEEAQKKETDLLEQYESELNKYIENPFYLLLIDIFCVLCHNTKAT